MICYSPSRHYLSAGIIAFALAVACGFAASGWMVAWAASMLFGLGGALLVALAFRPVITIQENCLLIGMRQIFWRDIERVDQTAWISPLVVKLQLRGGQRLWLIHPGDMASGRSLLRQLKRRARYALIDGLPYAEFWGEPAQTERKVGPPARRYPVLRPEDEAEVERLFQRLKTVGHLDSKSGGDE